MLWKLWFKGQVKLQQVQHPFRFNVSHDRFNKPWLLKVPNWTPKLRLGFTVEKAHDSRIGNMGENTLQQYILSKQMYFLLRTFCIILGKFFLSFHLMFSKTHKMDFWHKSSNTILVNFQMIVFSNKLLCIHTFMSIWMKNLI